MILKYLFFLFSLNLLLFLNLDKIAKFLNFYDIPDNNRKLHSDKVPNIGGFFFLFNLFFFLIFESFTKNHYFLYFFDNSEFYYFLIFAFLFFFIGAYDDKANLKATSKLFFCFVAIIFYLVLSKQVLITTLKFSFTNYNINLNYLSSLFITCFFILLFINAFNMLDGINGLAVLYFLLILFFSSFYIHNFLIVMIVVPFVFIFLTKNLNNKIFLGDNGSILMSFFLSVIFIKYYNRELFLYSDQVFIFMMIPGFDLLRLAIVRSLNNKHPFSADKNHLHHILLYEYGYSITLYWILFLVISPIIIFFLLNNSVISVVTGLFLYLSTVFLSKNKKKNI